MEEVAEDSVPGVIVIDNFSPYFTFDSPYSAPEKWAKLGKHSRRLYPGEETVPKLKAELKSWIEELSK